MILELLLSYYIALEEKFPDAFHASPSKIVESINKPVYVNKSTQESKKINSHNTAASASTLPCMQNSGQPCELCLKSLFPDAKLDDIKALGEEVKKIPLEQRPYFLGQVAVESSGLTQSVEKTDDIYEINGQYYDAVTRNKKGKRSQEGMIMLRRRKSGSLSAEEKQLLQDRAMANHAKMTSMTSELRGNTPLSKSIKKEFKKILHEYNKDLKKLRKEGGVQPVFIVKEDASGNPITRDTLVTKTDGEYSYTLNKDANMVGYETKILGFEHDLSGDYNKIKPGDAKNEDFLEVPREKIGIDSGVRKVEKNYLNQREDFVAQSKKGNPSRGQGYIQLTGDLEQQEFLSYYNSNVSDGDLKVTDLGQIGKNAKLKAASARYWWNKNKRIQRINLSESIEEINKKITNIVNGGSNHLKEREDNTTKAINVLNNCTCKNRLP